MTIGWQRGAVGEECNREFDDRRNGQPARRLQVALRPVGLSIAAWSRSSRVVRLG
jgi:hypothetical protein